MLSWIFTNQKQLGKKRYSDSNFTFELPITKYNYDYRSINYNETKVINGYKEVLKEIMFFTKEDNKSVIQN